MPTGWRPEGFSEKYPIGKITDPYHMNKYQTQFSMAGRVFIWAQFLITLFMLIWFFGNIASLTLYGMMTYGLMIFLTVYAYTDFMDKNKSFLIFEWIKNVLGLGFLLLTNHWNPMFIQYPAVKTGIVIYFIISGLVSFYFYKKEIIENPRMAMGLPGY